MDKTNSNSKVLTLSFAVAGVLTGLVVHFLMKSFGAAFGVVARLTDSDLVRHGLPVALGFVVFLLLQFNPRVLLWGEEVVTEVRKVVWPSRKDLVAMTIVVCVMVLISSIVISAFDFVAGYLVKMMVQ